RCCGLDCTGSLARETVPEPPALDISGPITVAAWVRPDATKTQYIVKKADGYTTDGYELSIASTGRPFFRLNEDTNSNTYRVDAPSAIPANGSTWTHLVGVYDGTTIRLYVNGVQVATKAGPSSIATNNLPLVIGDQPAGGYAFDGRIDEARVYSRA